MKSSHQISFFLRSLKHSNLLTLGAIRSCWAHWANMGQLLAGSPQLLKEWRKTSQPSVLENPILCGARFMEVHQNRAGSFCDKCRELRVTRNSLGVTARDGDSREVREGHCSSTCSMAASCQSCPTCDSSLPWKFAFSRYFSLWLQWCTGKGAEPEQRERGG